MSDVQNTPGTPDRRGRLWPWAIGGFLGLTVIKYIVILSMVGNDPSIAVQPDYYQKALAWDDERAAAEASRALGWHLEVQVGPPPPSPTPVLPGSVRPRGLATLRVTDSEGTPIFRTPAKVRVFHHARAAQPIDATGTTDADGTVEVALPFAQRGLWEVEIDMTRGDDHFHTTRTVLWSGS